MPAPLLLFDLDGTLVDTAADLMAALNATLSNVDLPPIPLAEVGQLVGAGGRVLIERGLTRHGLDPQAHDIDALLRQFNRTYQLAIPGVSRPYPGAIAAMDQLRAAGWRLAICTNKAEALARGLLDALGLADRFVAICGGDTFAMKKPDPGHLVGTIAAAGGARSAVMVGDSGADILAAKAAGIPVVAVTFGYCDQPVAAYQPDATIDHFNELWTTLQQLGLETRTHACI